MSNNTLKSAKETFISALSSALDHMVSEVENYDYASTEPLTLSGMAGSVEFIAGAGIDKTLLGLAMSTVTAECDEFYIQRGRNGGFKKGERPEPKEPKGPSEKARLKAQAEELMAKVAELEAQVKRSANESDTVAQAEAV